MSIFQRLGYNFNDPENVAGRLSDSAIKYLDTFPPILKEWQVNDLANNEVGGYYQNPVANVVQDIRNTSNTLITLLSANTSTNTNAVTGTTSTINIIFINVNTALSNISTNTSEKFIIHTNRMSAVTPLEGSNAEVLNVESTTEDTSAQPHYQTALGIGRLLLVLTHQTDAINNSAPVLGSFTSLFIANTLSNLSNSLSTYFDLINNSITVTGTGTEADPFVRNSNLTLSTVQSIENTVIEIKDTMNNRREHDINFYANSKNVFSELSSMGQFSQVGEVQKLLINDFIGTPKLITRINE
jgi:hypothetical protein